MRNIKKEISTNFNIDNSLLEIVYNQIMSDYTLEDFNHYDVLDIADEYISTALEESE